MSAFALIMVTIVIHSYINQIKKVVPFPKIFYGIPTYERSRLDVSMTSSPNIDPYMVVFITEDSYEKVLDFYKKQLKMNYRTVVYRGVKNTNRGLSMTVYQFVIKESSLKNYLLKGVEVMPFNRWSGRLNRGQTKIRIIIPQEEIKKAAAEAQQKKESTSTDK